MYAEREKNGLPPNPGLTPENLSKHNCYLDDDGQIKSLRRDVRDLQSWLAEFGDNAESP